MAKFLFYFSQIEKNTIARMANFVESPKKRAENSQQNTRIEAFSQA
jgi:hypothetical protein